MQKDIHIHFRTKRAFSYTTFSLLNTNTYNFSMLKKTWGKPLRNNPVLEEQILLKNQHRAHSLQGLVFHRAA